MWISIVVTLFYILGILSSINAVMTARTSQGAIAWVVSLITFPFVTVPAYWVFGNSRFNGYATARNSSNTKVQSGLKEILEGLDPYRLEESKISTAGVAAEKLADLPFLKKNSVQLLIDGKATFGSILEGIDSAASYILFQFYIVHDDEIGHKIKEHLTSKSKEGVKIYFLYDEIGSHDLPDSYKEDLQKAGVEIRSFHTQKGLGNRFQLNFRNHRKIIVVDGKTAWVGGLNIGDEYLGRDPKVGNWRDTHMKITGPAAIAVQVSFLEDWYWSTEQLIPEVTWTPTPAAEGNSDILIVPSGPADKLETATLMFLHTINSAKERIWIATPYFVPDDAILSALQLAGLRGIDVRILIPDKADNLLVNLSFYTYFDDASLTGVQFFRYTDGFLHEKVMLIDHDAATVGTANFDNRSFRLNFEITGLVLDPSFAEEIEAMFIDDFTRSREMTKSDTENQSFWFKLATRLARLTSPVQ